MTRLTNSFEGGTSGITISTGNSGGISGNAFDVVAIGSAATLTYSSTEAAHGSLSGKYVTGASSVNVLTEWSTSLTGSSVSTCCFRFYGYFPSLPSSTMVVCSILNGATEVLFVVITSSGTIQLKYGSGNTTAHTSTSAVAAGAWFRLEGFVVASASAGQVSFSYYAAPNSATATESYTSAASLNTGTGITVIRFGNPSSQASYTLYLDDVGASDTGYLGPVTSAGGGGRPGILAALIASGAI